MFQVRFLDSSNDERSAVFGDFDSVVMRGVTLIGLTSEQDDEVIIGETCPDDSNPSFWLDANGEGWTAFVIESAEPEDYEGPEEEFFYIAYVDAEGHKNTLYKGRSPLDWIRDTGNTATWWIEISEDDYTLASGG